MKKIQIKCTGSGVLPFQKIENFQGNLKRRSEEHVRKIVTSIEKYGFSFPFFIWKQGKHNWCLDGHGRLLALQKMFEDGWSVPDLPVAYIQAKDTADAKQKLLRMNSQYGEFDMAGAAEFVADIEVDLTEIEIPSISEITVLDDISEYSHKEQMDELDGCEDAYINFAIPKKHVEEVICILTKDYVDTAPGRGKGVLRLCGLL